MKKCRLIFIIVVLTILWDIIAAEALNFAIDTKNAKDGLVKIYSPEVDTIRKVMVEKGRTQYFYNLKDREEIFPLQFGQGNYTVAILENISGNEYKVLFKKVFKADIKEENDVYLKSMQIVLWDRDDKAIELAKELTKNKKEDEEIVQVIYFYIIDKINYDYKKMDRLSNDYIPYIDEILIDGSGICYDYSVLFAAMLRSRGIPTKLVKGYKNDLDSYHAWNEVYLNGSWKIIDTTYDVWELKHSTGSTIYKNESEYEKVKEY